MFRKGDKVELAGVDDCPAMTVSDVHGHDVHVRWFAGGALCERTFAASELKVHAPKADVSHHTKEVKDHK